jgi:hypothetical protein
MNGMIFLSYPTAVDTGASSSLTGLSFYISIMVNSGGYALVLTNKQSELSHRPLKVDSYMSDYVIHRLTKATANQLVTYDLIVGIR